MSVRLELSDLPPRIRAQAEAQIAARGQKKAPAAPSMATAASIAETAGMEFDSRGEYNYYMGVILPKVQRGADCQRGNAPGVFPAPGKGIRKCETPGGQIHR